MARRVYFQVGPSYKMPICISIMYIYVERRAQKGGLYFHMYRRSIM